MKQKILDWLETNMKFSWPWHLIAGYGGYWILQWGFGPWLSLFAVIAGAYLTEEWDRLAPRDVGATPEPWIDYWTTVGWKDWAWYVAGALGMFLGQVI